MDMSWGMQQQMQNQMYGDYVSQMAAMQYLAMMGQLRANGYTGPSLSTGVTTQSLQNSINGLNDARQRYIDSQSRNSDARSRSVENWSNGAIRGCSWTVNAYGQRIMWCP